MSGQSFHRPRILTISRDSTGIDARDGPGGSSFEYRGNGGAGFALSAQFHSDPFDRPSSGIRRLLEGRRPVVIEKLRAVLPSRLAASKAILRELTVFDLPEPHGNPLA